MIIICITLIHPHLLLSCLCDYSDRPLWMLFSAVDISVFNPTKISREQMPLHSRIDHFASRLNSRLTSSVVKCHILFHWRTFRCGHLIKRTHNASMFIIVIGFLRLSRLLPPSTNSQYIVGYSRGYRFMFRVTITRRSNLWVSFGVLCNDVVGVIRLPRAWICADRYWGAAEHGARRWPNPWWRFLPELQILPRHDNGRTPRPSDPSRMM